jgi:hypothetical protein
MPIDLKQTEGAGPRWTMKKVNGRGKTVSLRPYSVSNVLATVYHALGIDPALTFPWG